jgi:hypothetical protein
MLSNVKGQPKMMQSSHGAHAPCLLVELTRSHSHSSGPISSPKYCLTVYRGNWTPKTSSHYNLTHALTT